MQTVDGVNWSVLINWKREVIIAVIHTRSIENEDELIHEFASANDNGIYFLFLVEVNASSSGLVISRRPNGIKYNFKWVSTPDLSIHRDSG